jgi:hypothetical protein
MTQFYIALLILKIIIISEIRMLFYSINLCVTGAGNFRRSLSKLDDFVFHLLLNELTELVIVTIIVNNNTNAIKRSFSHSSSFTTLTL